MMKIPIADDSPADRRGHMMQTKWKVALYLDERASAEQQKALGGIFSGQAGGHLAVVAPLIGSCSA